MRIAVIALACLGLSTIAGCGDLQGPRASPDPPALKAKPARRGPSVRQDRKVSRVRKGRPGRKERLALPDPRARKANQASRDLSGRQGRKAILDPPASQDRWARKATRATRRSGQRGHSRARAGGRRRDIVLR